MDEKKSEEVKKEAPFTDAHQFLTDLNGGTLLDLIGAALSDVALGVVNHGKPGKVQITLELKRIGELAQVTVDHTLSFVKPTKNGKRGEESSGQTPMYVAFGGKLSLFMPNQFDMFQGHQQVSNDRVKS